MILRKINTSGLISNRDASQTVNITAIEPQIEAPVSLALVSLYPAWYAARMEPVEALHSL